MGKDLTRSATRAEAVHGKLFNSMRKNMLRKFAPLTTKLFALAACSVLMAASLFAQSQATTGDIEGRVLDPNGAAVPNATVTGVNQATGFERTVTADGEGNYRLILLPP